MRKDGVALQSVAVRRLLSSSAFAVGASVVGVALMALVASVPRSPYQPVLPEGAGPGGPFAALARVVGLDALHGSALAAAGVGCAVFAAAAFLLVLRTAWRREVSLRTVVILIVAYHLVILTLPLLFSRDVYSYIAYGRIAALHHANPYVQTPLDFRNDAIFGFVGHKWVGTPAVYGPLFTLVSALLTRGIGSIVALIVVFRVIAIVVSLATIGVVAWLTGRLWPERRIFAIAALGLNPVVLFNSVASGHNDMLVALSIAGALALVVSRRDLIAVAVLTLGALVKASALLPLVLLIVVIVARAPTGRRLRAFAASAGLTATIGALFAAPFFQLHDPTLGLVGLAAHEGWLAPSRFFRRVLDLLSFGTLGVVARVGFALLFLVVVVALAREAARRAPSLSPLGLGGRWGWALLCLALLGPVLLPWYVTWSLPLIWLLPRVPRTVLLATSTALAVSQWAAEPTRFALTYSVNTVLGYYIVTPVLVGGLLWLLADLRGRLRAGASLEDLPDHIPASAGED